MRVYRSLSIQSEIKNGKGNEHDAEDRINEESNNFKNSFLEVSIIIKDLFFLLGKKKKDI